MHSMKTERMELRLTAEQKLRLIERAKREAGGNMSRWVVQQIEKCQKK